MLRLMLPFSVPSPFSAMNLLPRQVNTQTVAVQTVGPPPEPPSPAAPVPDPAVDTVTLTGSPDIVMPPAENTGAVFAPVTAAMEPLEIAAIVWLAGVALVAAVLIAGNIRFLRRLKRRQAYEAPGFMALLDECKALLGLRRKLSAIQAQGVSAAAVYGVIRPPADIARVVHTAVSGAAAACAAARAVSYPARRYRSLLPRRCIKHPPLVQSACLAGLCADAAGYRSALRRQRDRSAGRA